jgi:hypothetical protein
VHSAIHHAAGYLDSEWTLASFGSACVLIGAAIAALLFASALRSNDIGAKPVVGLAALFVFMASDEVFSIHENLDVWFGTPGYVVYAPLLASAFGLWLLTRRRLAGRSRRLFDLGAATWVAAQACELAAHPPIGPGIHTVLLVFPEELGEVAGTALFGLALLTAARDLAAPRWPIPRFAPLRRLKLSFSVSLQVDRESAA